MHCVNHPEVATGLSCGRCGQALCVDCAQHTQVGTLCARCAYPELHAQIERLPSQPPVVAPLVSPLWAAIGVVLVGLLLPFAVSAILPIACAIRARHLRLAGAGAMTKAAAVSMLVLLVGLPTLIFAVDQDALDASLQMPGSVAVAAAVVLAVVGGWLAATTANCRAAMSSAGHRTLASVALASVAVAGLFYATTAGVLLHAAFG